MLESRLQNYLVSQWVSRARLVEPLKWSNPLRARDWPVWKYCQYHLILYRFIPKRSRNSSAIYHLRTFMRIRPYRVFRSSSWACRGEEPRQKVGAFFCAFLKESLKKPFRVWGVCPLTPRGHSSPRKARAIQAYSRKWEVGRNHNCRCNCWSKNQSIFIINFLKRGFLRCFTVGW